MFRITRGITIQPTPAFSPVFRFADGMPLPIYRDDEPESTPIRSEPSADASEPVPSLKRPADPPPS